MGKGLKTTQMGISIRVNSLMDSLRAMESIYGLISLFTKATSSKGIKMDMEHGSQAIKNSSIKVITYWIENTAMEFTVKKMEGSIKEIILKIREMGMENSMKNKR